MDVPIAEDEAARERILLGLRLAEGVPARDLEDWIRTRADAALWQDYASWMEERLLRRKRPSGSDSRSGVSSSRMKSSAGLFDPKHNQWQEGQTTGVKMSANARPRGASADYVNKIDDIRAKGKKIGTETVNGHACEIYEYNETSERGGTAKQTYWLAKDLKNFPVKVVAEIGDVKVTTVNSDIELGAAVPDSMVTPPDNVKFQDMSEMMKGKSGEEVKTRNPGSLGRDS